MSLLLTVSQKYSTLFTVLIMSQKFLHVVPIRFTRAQLVAIDQQASQLKIQRSTFIRDSVLQNLVPQPNDKALTSTNTEVPVVF